jgi:hypothetical protein
MRSYSGIRTALGTRGALAYLHDYHEQHINRDGTWGDAVYEMDMRGHDEREVAEHARFMDECGADFIRYRRFNKEKL